jgi:hypothetical protein
MGCNALQSSNTNGTCRAKPGTQVTDSAPETGSRCMSEHGGTYI